MTFQEKVKLSCVIFKRHAIENLKGFLGKISNLPLDSTAYQFELCVNGVVITPESLTLLIQVLNQPLPQPATAMTERKWDDVKILDCSLAREGTTKTTADASGYCSPDDMRLLLGATLASRTVSLTLGDSPDILECLLGSPELEMETLTIFVSGMLSAERLGGLVPRNVHLIYLELSAKNPKVAQMLLEAFSYAIHLQKLVIFGYCDMRGQRREPLTRQGGHDMVLTFLQNLQIPLQILDLQHMCMDDQLFMAIVRVLPTSRLEVLNVSCNRIQREGILAFAAQLPRIKCLKVATVCYNSWDESPEGREEGWVALSQGLSENYSIERLNWSFRDLLPVADVLHLYCDLNRAGRRILATTNSVPVGLWPFILERAGKDLYHDDKWWCFGRAVRLQQSKAQSVSFLLQNSTLF